MARVIPDETAHRVHVLCVLYLRRPDGIATDSVTGLPVVDFTPPLSPAEQTIYARLVKLARSTIPGITPAEWQALEPDLAAMRTFRQQSQAEFMALTATQRDRALFDVVNAQTNVLRALLRD